MLRNTAVRIAEWSLRSCGNEKEKTVIQYGIEVFLENVIKIIIIISAGVLLKRFGETVLVLATFSGIRISAGGIHARTSNGCTLMMLGVVFIALFADCLPAFPVAGIVVCCVYSMWIISKYAPNGSRANVLLSQEERRRKVRRALLTVVVFSLSAFELGVRNLVLTSMVLEAVTIQIAKEKKNGEN